MSSKGNSSSAGGSAGSPTSLSAAIGRVVPGSVVCLEAGTYDTSSTIMLSRSGSSAAAIVYRNYGGAAVLRYIGGSSGRSLGGGVLQIASGPNWDGTHDIVIDGLTLDGAGVMAGGIFATNGDHHITIENCVVRNTGSTGIEMNAADYVTVEHNQIYHAGYNQGWSSGIDLWYGGTEATYGGPTAWYDRAAGFHNVIADNVVSGTYDNSSYHSDGNGIIVDGSGSIPPVLIVNNLVYENGGRGIEISHNSGQVWVVNNTGYADGLDRKVDGGRAAEFASFYAIGVHFVNNLAYGHDDGRRYTAGATYMNVDSTISWAHDIGFNGSAVGVASVLTANPGAYRSANPRFITPPTIPGGSMPWSVAIPPWLIGNDLTLRRHSPARRAGINAITAAGMNSALARGLQHYIRTDLAGKPRGAKTDIGAY